MASCSTETGWETTLAIPTSKWIPSWSLLSRLVVHNVLRWVECQRHWGRDVARLATSCSRPKRGRGNFPLEGIRVLGADIQIQWGWGGRTGLHWAWVALVLRLPVPHFPIRPTMYYRVNQPLCVWRRPSHYCVATLLLLLTVEAVLSEQECLRGVTVLSTRSYISLSWDTADCNGRSHRKCGTRKD